MNNSVEGHANIHNEHINELVLSMTVIQNKFDEKILFY